MSTSPLLSHLPGQCASLDRNVQTESGWRQARVTRGGTCQPGRLGPLDLSIEDRRAEWAAQLDTSLRQGPSQRHAKLQSCGRSRGILRIIYDSQVHFPKCCANQTKLRLNLSKVFTRSFYVLDFLDCQMCCMQYVDCAALPICRYTQQIPSTGRPVVYAVCPPSLHFHQIRLEPGPRCL